jgi:hypothetical protein
MSRIWKVLWLVVFSDAERRCSVEILAASTKLLRKYFEIGHDSVSSTT